MQKTIPRLMIERIKSLPPQIEQSMGFAAIIFMLVCEMLFHYQKIIDYALIRYTLHGLYIIGFTISGIILGLTIKNKTLSVVFFRSLYLGLILYFFLANTRVRYGQDMYCSMQIMVSYITFFYVMGMISILLKNMYEEYIEDSEYFKKHLGFLSKDILNQVKKIFIRVSAYGLFIIIGYEFSIRFLEIFNLNNHPLFLFLKNHFHLFIK